MPWNRKRLRACSRSRSAQDPQSAPAKRISRSKPHCAALNFRLSLQGVTGSGKTEVYLKSIDAAIALGRSALLLVPEIALTPAMAGQFFHRFGDRVAILHSAFHDAERAEQWRRIRSGVATVVVGTRSGVFAPVQNLGLVVWMRNTTQSYKQQDTPRYNGRDVAIVRERRVECGGGAGLGDAQS